MGGMEKDPAREQYIRTSESPLLVSLLQFFFSDSKMSCLVRITVACYRDGVPALQTPKRGAGQALPHLSPCPTAPDSLAPKPVYRPGPSHGNAFIRFYQSEKIKIRVMQYVSVYKDANCPFWGRVILHSEIIPFLGRVPFSC